MTYWECRETTASVMLDCGQVQCIKLYLLLEIFLNYAPKYFRLKFIKLLPTAWNITWNASQGCKRSCNMRQSIKSKGTNCQVWASTWITTKCNGTGWIGCNGLEIGRTQITGINRSILLPPYQVIDHLRLESRSWISDFCNKFWFQSRAINSDLGKCSN